MDKEEEKALEELTEEVEKEEANENSSLSSDELKKISQDVIEEPNTIEEIAKPTSLNPLKITAPLENAKAHAKKGFLDLIKKHPYILAGFLIIFIIMIGILIYAMNYDLNGVGHPKPSFYVEAPSYGKVFLTWESEAYYTAHKDDKDYEPITDPNLVDLDYEDENKIKRWEYKEYSYDTYITGIVWNDNNQAKDIDNEIVYEAMAVAARSRLIATLPDNCVVLKFYNEQAKSFIELTGNEPKYAEISQAVSNTQGLMIGRNRHIIEALYDTFSYVKKILEDDSNYKHKYFYHMMHKNNEMQQIIPAKWVDDLEDKKGVEIPKEKVPEIKFLASLSLYGAKYLQEHEDYDYDLYRILETYYGRDIDYYTIDYESSDKKPITGPIVGSNGNGCYTWPIGSIETTIENGVEVALGTPETVTITSGFGGRDTGISGASTNHKGIDIAGGRGRGAVNIIAMAGGTVKEVKNGCVTGDYACGSKWGNHIVIDHGNGISTRYAHMYSINVSVGQTVVKGQVLGKIGNTGNVGGSKGKPTGPNDTRGTHLHFEVMENGTRVNPENYVSKVEPRPTNCGGSNSLPLDPIIGGDNKQITCLALKRAGYGDVQVAGMMANAEGESGFRPNAFNPSGGGIGAYGLFQWRAGRQKNLKALKNYDTLEVQVAFAVSELNTGYRTANVKLINSTTPSDASYNFCVYYEVPGRTTEEAQKNCVVRRTNGVADKHYQYVKNGCK